MIYPFVLTKRLRNSTAYSITDFFNLAQNFLDIFHIDNALKFKHLYFLINFSYKIAFHFNPLQIQPIANVQFCWPWFIF